MFNTQLSPNTDQTSLATHIVWTIIKPHFYQQLKEQATVQQQQTPEHSKEKLFDTKFSEKDLLASGEFRYLVGRAFYKSKKKYQKYFETDTFQKTAQRSQKYFLIHLMKCMELQEKSNYAHSHDSMLQKSKYGNLTTVNDQISHLFASIEKQYGLDKVTLCADMAEKKKGLF